MPVPEGQTCLGCNATSTPEWRRGPLGLSSHFPFLIAPWAQLIGLYRPPNIVQCLWACVRKACTSKKRVSRTVVPYHLRSFIDDPRLKNGNEMRHVAQRTRRTRTMAHRATRPGLHLAAMRMSRLLKSFEWRTSMAAGVADATLLLPTYPPTHPPFTFG